MNDDIIPILKDYVNHVEDICRNLIKGINHAEDLGLKSKYDFFTYLVESGKTEFEIWGIKYILHGKGCTAFGEKIFLDWEFGCRSRWCGIDPYKVSMTLRKNNSPFTKYYDGNAVKEACKRLVDNGIMFEKYNLYYFQIPASETFKPSFPSEYDTLVIEHSTTSRTVPRNKVIDRFIRKSTWVYSHIERNSDRYMLRFLRNGAEVYTIPYNDTGYPEHAVEIMSDEILRALEKTGTK